MALNFDKNAYIDIILLRSATPLDMTHYTYVQFDIQVIRANL